MKESVPHVLHDLLDGIRNHKIWCWSNHLSAVVLKSLGEKLGLSSVVEVIPDCADLTEAATRLRDFALPDDFKPFGLEPLDHFGGGAVVGQGELFS